MTRPVGRSRILIADDDAPTREQLALLLATEHDVVALVGDGKAAVEAAVQLGPDLALLDISMPVMSGIAAARHLRKCAHAIKVVFITNHVETAYVEEAFRLGAAGYVLKPNLAAELPIAIRTVLAGGTYRSSLLG
ncbi:MAG: response regulator transcription factor [Nannocystis sp.]|nr:response regulator transcription factor [Nannocystis sp.]MBA3548675.1 response regulator transcription factor [Nannocystis sp.]